MTFEEESEKDMAMLLYLRQGGFTEEDIQNFRNRPQRRNNTKNREFKSEIERRLEEGQTVFNVADIKKWPSNPYLRGKSNPAAEVKRILNGYGLESKTRGVYVLKSNEENSLVKMVEEVKRVSPKAVAINDLTRSYSLQFKEVVEEGLKHGLVRDGPKMYYPKNKVIDNV